MRFATSMSTLCSNHLRAIAYAGGFAAVTGVICYFIDRTRDRPTRLDEAIDFDQESLTPSEAGSIDDKMILQNQDAATCTWFNNWHFTRPFNLYWYSDSEELTDSEEYEETMTLEKREIPMMHHHLKVRGFSDIALKLCALRKAFSTLLSDIHTQNLLLTYGQMILLALVRENKGNVIHFQKAYNSLISFLERSSNQVATERELLAARVYHLNFLDVLFELFLFRLFAYNTVPVAAKGGFLDRLLSLMDTWDSPNIWEPAAEQYYWLLNNQLKELLDDLFSQPLELYCSSDSLVPVVFALLMHHLQIMVQRHWTI